MCIGYGINLPGTEEARKELSMLVKETTKDGVSLLAREISTNKIVGFSFNKLQVAYTPNQTKFPTNSSGSGYFLCFSFHNRLCFVVLKFSNVRQSEKMNIPQNVLSEPQKISLVKNLRDSAL